MICSQCEHNFCWLCLGKWSLHGDRTGGGYFRCNRFRAEKIAQDQIDAARGVEEIEHSARNKKFFKHVYSRYSNHTDSLRYEEALLTSAHEKIEALISNAFTGQHHIMEPDDKEGKFVKEALRELLKSRLALRASYAMSYYIPQYINGDDLVKAIAPLERSTEDLAEIIARPHLCTPKDKIVLATMQSREVRRKFLPEARKHNVSKILLVEQEEELDKYEGIFDNDSLWSYDSSSSEYESDSPIEWSGDN